MPSAGTFKLVMYPVGQGLFQSLNYWPRRFHGNCESYNAVFDCGTLASTREARIRSLVENFVDHDLFGGVYSINQLTISHLHWDHVSLLPSLLTKVNVDRVVLPYLTPCERLYELITEPSPHLDWYVRFISDPVSFLLNFGVREVFIIGEGEEGGPSPYSPDNPEEFFPDDRMREAEMAVWTSFVYGGDISGIHRLSRSYENNEEFEHYEDILWEYFKSKRFASRIRPLLTPTLLVSGCRNRIGTHLIFSWPFIRKIGLNSQTTRDFIDKISDLLHMCDVSNGQELIDTEGNCYLRSSDILKLLRRFDCIRKMRRIYSNYLKKLNEHSLTTLVNAVFKGNSGLIGGEIRYRYSPRLYYNNDGYVLYNPDVSIGKGKGFLFMGDLSAKEKGERSRIFNSLANYFGRAIRNLSFYQVPHHGSDNGWDSALDDLTTDLAAVSYGYNNLYGHPHEDHLWELHSRSRYLVEVNEKSRHLISYWYLA